ncbi:peptidoglycan DD-metalloendopeptidase family protein [uncultured Roseobacter sp.]|uniref:peptidoglycan DD-metalloendopeptidase family protein n=1 Tax=uncultured Roseobacter sp. TaxID=114847 RepID=UPI0026155214|nr:peptidoglycan DD-metalloendopeptidase family protein [uncultured Roseobacter sp.]
MTLTISRRRVRLSAMTITALLTLTACSDPLDFDLRGIGGGFSTAGAATGAATAERPAPDARGVISYPNYQVAVAERGDTIESVATRLGISSTELARFNGIEETAPLRRGEVIALPDGVSVASAATPGAASGGVDIGALAGNAIDRVPEAQGVQTTALPPAATTVAQPAPAQEPTRHKVERGETAYTIARLYQVPVTSLAEWNGLGPGFAIREGQFLLIPVAQQAPPNTASAEVTPPGAGSPTPTPPSAVKPLPEQAPTPVVEPAPPVDVGTQTETTADARMVFPVTGAIIREYAKGKNEGINIKADPGTEVKAADSGTVAAVTKSAEGVPIIVIRHDPELLTVYANVTDVTVEKGTKVNRGDPIAKLRDGSDAYVHFEVRQGFDSVDPMPYLQ